jgi:hypothetical protein
MALIKEIELSSGIPVRYHRVVSVNDITNVQTIVEVASYTSQAKREAEKAALATGEAHNVFIETRYYSAPYGTCPTVTRAYEWLKANVGDFAGAEDVFDEGDPSDEVSGEEFVSMLEEVM